MRIKPDKFLSLEALESIRNYIPEEKAVCWVTYLKLWKAGRKGEKFFGIQKESETE